MKNPLAIVLFLASSLAAPLALADDATESGCALRFLNELALKSNRLMRDQIESYANTYPSLTCATVDQTDVYDVKLVQSLHRENLQIGAADRDAGWMRVTCRYGRPGDPRDAVRHCEVRFFFPR